MLLPVSCIPFYLIMIRHDALLKGTDSNQGLATHELALSLDSGRTGQSWTQEWWSAPGLGKRVSPPLSEEAPGTAAAAPKGC